MKPIKRTLMTASALSLTLMLSGCFHESMFGDPGAGDDCAAGETCSVDDVDSFDQEVKTDKVSAKLSGVVQLTNTNGAFAKPGVARKPFFAADVSGQAIEGTPAPKTLILAVDAWGNTISDQADSVGGFDMELDAGKLYAVIFIDTRTMEVLGSLVQAANTENAAAVALADNTNLGAVVIDPVSGRAVAEADATPETVTQEEGVEIKVVDASALDADGDGMVTQDDITELQAKALEEGLASGESKIKKLSPLNFMGDRNTWVAETRERHESWSHSYYDEGAQAEMSFSFEGDVKEGQFRIVREKQVDGPNGGQITALKHADVTYMRHETGTETRTEPNGTGGVQTVTEARDWGGYYNGLIAKINADWGDGAGNFEYTYATLTAEQKAQLSEDCLQQMQDRDNANETWGVWCGDPFQGAEFKGLPNYKTMKFTWETGLWAWARYQFADQENGVIVEGEWDHQDRKVSWDDGGGIPLELAIGETITETHTESWTDGSDGSSHELTMTSSIVPTLVDGMLTDTLGRKLPIIHITMSMGTATYTVDGVATDLPDWMADEVGKNSKGMYILAKYGAEAEAVDENGVAIAWQDAFAGFRFGIISRAVSSADAETLLAEKCGGTTSDKTSITMNADEDKNLVICKTSPESLAKADGTTVDMSGPMPGGVGTPEARNSWLAFLSKNINQLEVVDYNNFEDQAGNDGAGGGSWFWVEQNEEVWAGVEPLNWDPVNYLQYPLTAGTTQQFVTTKNPDTTVGGETADDANVHYSSDKAVEFYYELRVWDPEATNQHDSTMKGNEVAIATSAAISQAATTNGEEAVVSLDGTVAVPDLTKNSTVYPETWTFWEHNPNTGEESVYCSAGASMWLVMKVDHDDDVNTAAEEVMAQPIGWYDIKGDRLAAGENCDKWAGSTATP